jgi:hypothetical protein
MKRNSLKTPFRNTDSARFGRLCWSVFSILGLINDMTNNKTTFTLNRDIIYTLEMLTNEQAGRLIKHIFKYVNGENPESDDLLIKVCFAQIKIDIDSYENIRPKGKNHWNWKDGISGINKTIRNSVCIKEWRLSVFERDNYTCQNCEQRGCVLHAHHIKSFSKHPDLRFNINNGVTLCKPCHNLIHSKSHA